MQSIAITVEYNLWCREERLKAIQKDQAKQKRLVSVENKLERLIETAITLLNIEEKKYEVEIRNDDWKIPTPCPQEKRTRSLQDISNMQSMYDEQDFKS